MKLDLTDNHLLFLLEQDGRLPLTALSAQLSISREAVHYRIKRLQREGILNGFVTRINPAHLGLSAYITYLKLRNLHAKEHSEFLNELARHGEITWMASLGGKFDLVFEIMAPSIREFDRFLTAIQTRHTDEIGTCVTATRSFQQIFGKKYLWPQKIAMIKEAAKTGAITPALDELDRKILAAISTEARMPVIGISQRTGIPPTTVSFRLRQLEKNGVIEGYTAFSTFEKLGYFRFKALITARSFSGTQEHKLFSFCRQHPQISFYTKTLGSWNYEIEVDVQSPSEYQQFLIDFRSRFSDSVQDIDSLSVFKEYKLTYFPLAGNEKPTEPRADGPISSQSSARSCLA